VLLGLDQVVGEDLRELRVTGDARRRAQLLERLLLDRVRVGEVLGELLVDVAIRHGVLGVWGWLPRLGARTHDFAAMPEAAGWD
jgi:hypothetical protein